MKPIEEARAKLTAENAKGEDSEFMKLVAVALGAGMKLKKAMVAKGLGAAKAKCPKCQVEGALHGRLVIGSGAGRHRSSGGAFRMWCETAGCGLSMIE